MCTVQFIVIILYIKKKAWLYLSKKITLLKMTQLIEINKYYHIIKTNKIMQWSNVTSKSKVKQSLYGPKQTVRVPGGWGSQISRQSAHIGGKVVSPKHRPPSPPQGIFLVLISVTGWVVPRATVRPEGLCQWKIRMTSSWIEPTPFRLVASTKCATACPRCNQ